MNITMKKIISLFALVALFGLGLALPALAEENEAAEVKSEKPVAAYEPRAVAVRGSITAISGTVLPVDVTIKLDKITPKKIKNFPGTFPAEGSVLVLHLTADTKLVRKYLGQSSLSELAVGDKIDVTGKLQADGTVNAGWVKDNSVHVTFNAKRGTVLTVDPAAKIFTLKREDGKEFKIYVTDATKFAKIGLSAPTFADLKVGDVVVVRGVIRQVTSEVNADSVVIKVGEKEKELKQLELKKKALEKKVEAAKNLLNKLQTELEAILKKIAEAGGGTPVVTPVPTSTATQ